MTSAEETGLGEYSRAIEQMWSELLDRPVVLSRRDWDLLSSWFERCIPLQLIREALQPQGRTAKKPPRTLSHVSMAVEDAWAVVLQGRIASHAEELYPSNDMATALTHWTTRLSAEVDGSPLHSLLHELLGRLASGEHQGPSAAPREHRSPRLNAGIGGGFHRQDAVAQCRHRGDLLRGDTADLEFGASGDKRGCDGAGIARSHAK